MSSLYYKQRWMIIFLCKSSPFQKWTPEQAARYLKISPGAVRTWIKRYEETGTVDDLPRPGRNPVTTQAQDRQMVKLIESEKANSSSEVAQKLSNKGVAVSSRTVRKRLKKHGFHYGKRTQKPLLSPIHIEKRLNWALANKDRDWSRVIFSDESLFYRNYQRKSVWKRRNEVKLIRTTKHCERVSMWGCFSAQGFGKLIVIKGILESKQMTKIYRRGLLPSATKLYGANSRDWFLLEDKDPKHTSKLSKQWKGQNGVQVLEWPPNSPDCNPIENVWAYLKAKLSKKYFKNLDALIRGIFTEWSKLPADYAKKLAESCDRRCQSVIENEGEWTPY
jgi:transposase